MMNRGLENRGFTLMEVMIVVVILGVIASLAIPNYSVAIENNRKQEALRVLLAAREAEMRFAALNNNAFSAGWAALDYDATDTADDPAGMVRHFTYALQAGGAQIQATRNNTDKLGPVPNYTGTMAVGSGVVTWNWP